VRVHLGASVPGQGFVEFVRQLASVLDQSVDDGLRVFAIELYQHHVPRLAFDQGRDLAIGAAENQVAFPVTWHRSIVG